MGDFEADLPNDTDDAEVAEEAFDAADDVPADLAGGGLVLLPVDAPVDGIVLVVEEADEEEDEEEEGPEGAGVLGFVEGAEGEEATEEDDAVLVAVVDAAVAVDVVVVAIGSPANDLFVWAFSSSICLITDARGSSVIVNGGLVVTTDQW